MPPFRKSDGSSADNVTTNIEDSYPLSPLQQVLLLSALRDPESGVDIEQVICELREPIDGTTFKRAWERVVARHPVLRTSFRWRSVDEPQQDVHAQVQLVWKECDWCGVSDCERDRRFETFLSEDRRSGFDFARPPLFRLTLFRYAADDNRLVITFHHSILEGRSYALLLREVFAFYEACCRGEEIDLPLPRPYRDYIDWLDRQDYRRHEEFWRHTLRDFTAATPLVIDHEESVDRHRNRSAYQEVRLSAAVTSALRSVADSHQVTLTTILQGAWALLLSRYSGETDVIFGVVRAGRRHTVAGAEQMIGLFINTLPLRVRVNSESALLPWLEEVRSQWTAMREREHTPLAHVQGWSELPAGSSLFQSTVMFDNLHLNAQLGDEGSSSPHRRFRVLVQPGYSLNLAGYNGPELRLKLDFDRNRIDDAVAERLLGHVRTLLEAMAHQPHRRVGDLPLLTAGERSQLLTQWNQTVVEYPTHAGLHQLFEAQVKRTPDAIAITFEKQHLTYQELNRRSNQLAHHLRGLGIGPDVLVAICAERSLAMVVGLLGILKAGGAYVPIDPTYPTERVAFMLRDANPPVVLAPAKLLDTLPIPDGTVAVNLDSTDWSSSVGNADNPVHTVTDANLAYVIYTSGSTGEPKGAMIPHRAIVNHVRWMQSTFPMDARSRVLQKTEFSFDVSVWEFFAPLAVGARLVIARPNGHKDPVYLTQAIVEHQISVLQLVPSQLRMMLETAEFKACTSLQHVFCGGEVLPGDAVRLFFATLPAQLHNLYGPTEVAIDSLLYSVPRAGPHKTIPIGRPVANTQAYVLDPDRRPVPIGVAGELHLGGIQVGRGYHNRPELTAERFISDPFSGVEGARLYRTGDKARFLPDGNIEFLGRIDHQVKLHGFRIELSEIESILQSHTSVRGSAVVVREDAPNGKRLVAYITASNSNRPTGTELRNFLKQKLPPYMVPSAFVWLDAFPLTANGKLDRKALPSPEANSVDFRNTHVAARTSTEETLAAIWSELLGLRQIGIRDNFFELGGHSLLVIRLINRVSQTLGVNLSVPDLFKNPTVEHIARLIVAQQPNRKRRPGVVQLQEGTAEPPIYFLYTGPDEFRLAQLTGNGHPVFGIEVPWPLTWRTAVADDRLSALPTMEELVAPYVTLLRAHIKSSSCILAGFCFAGLLAFEAAHQFQRVGGKVETVILYDTWAKRPTPKEIALHKWAEDGRRIEQQYSKGWPWNSIGLHLRKSWLMIAWLCDMAMKRTRSVWSRLLFDRGTSYLFDDQGTSLPWELVDRFYTHIRHSYRLHRLNARGILFQPEDRPHVRSVDRGQGWSDLFSEGLEVVPVDGGHLSMLREASFSLVLGKKIEETMTRHWQHRGQVRVDAR